MKMKCDRFDEKLCEDCGAHYAIHDYNLSCRRARCSIHGKYVECKMYVSSFKDDIERILEI